MKQKKLVSRNSWVSFAVLASSGLMSFACAKQQAVESSSAPQATPSAPRATTEIPATPVKEAPSPAVAEPAAARPTLIKDVGFATPESVLFDADTGVYLVSNINGSPGGKDDNGFISQVDPNGTVITLKWIDG